jgi:hypothetical protein
MLACTAQPGVHAEVLSFVTCIWASAAHGYVGCAGSGCGCEHAAPSRSNVQLTCSMAIDVVLPDGMLQAAV